MLQLYVICNYYTFRHQYCSVGGDVRGGELALLTTWHTDFTDQGGLSKTSFEQKIYPARGQKVMLDRDLAGLYGVETRVLNQAIRRNIERFPDDFMLVLTREEIMRISQIVTSSGPNGRGDLKRSGKEVR